MRTLFRSTPALLILAGSIAVAPSGHAQAPAGAPAAPPMSAGMTPIESSAEARFQLDLVVPTAAITAMLPPGFTLNVSTTGAAKDCNLRLIFIDRMTINAPDGKPMGKGSSRMAMLAAPVKDPNGVVSQVIVGGLVDDPADAPGPFGNFIYAPTHNVMRSSSNASGTVIDSHDWVLEAPSGEHLELHIKYEHGIANRGNAGETRYVSGKDPKIVIVSRDERVMDIVRNPTTNPPDKVKEFSFKVSGGSYSKIFDGTTKVVSWDNNIWLNRTLFK